MNKGSGLSKTYFFVANSVEIGYDIVAEKQCFAPLNTKGGVV